MKPVLPLHYHSRYGGAMERTYTHRQPAHTGCKKAGSVDTGWPVANVTSIAGQ